MVTFAVCAAATAAIASAGTRSTALSPESFPSAEIVVRGLGVGLLISVTFGSAGLLLGTVLRSVGGAIAAALLWSVVAVPLLENLGFQIKALTPLTYALPDTSAVLLTAVFDEAAGMGQTFFPVQGTIVLPIVVGWSLTFLALTADLLHRRDIATAGSRPARRLPSARAEGSGRARQVPVRSARGPDRESAAPGPSRTGGVIDSMRAELIVLARWPAARAFLLITPLYTVLTGYLMQYVFYQTTDSGTFANLSADQILPTILPGDFVTVALNDFGANANYDGTVPFLLLGALVAGSDWGRGTIKTSLLQGPSRTRTVIGQAMAVLLALAASAVATFLLCAGASTLIALAQTGSLSPSSGPFPTAAVVARGVGAGLLVSFAYGAAGLALGTVFRSAGGATAAVLLWTVVVTPVLDLVGLQFHGALRALYQALPDANTLTLTHLFGLADSNNNPVVLVAPAAGAAVLAVYAAAFLIIPILLVRRRDVA